MKARYFVAVLSFFLSIAIARPLSSTAATTPSSPTCSEILSSLGTGKLGNTGVDTQRLGARISAVRSQLARLPETGVVVYSVAPTRSGMAMMRFESMGKDKPLLEQVVSETRLDGMRFRKAIAAAPGNRYQQNLIRTEFPRPQDARDNGKLIFFLDPDGYGLVPQAFDFQDAPVLASLDLERAVRNFRILQSERNGQAKYAAVIGIPHTPDEYLKTFKARTGESRYPPLEVWSSEWRAAQDIVARHNVELIPISTKEMLLDRIGTYDGVVFIVAHSDGLHIELPGAETISISPSDIANTRFAGNPFIFLRVCQGEDIGFADAFLKAGARGVWTNRGVIDATVANHQTDLFMRELRSNKTVPEAITAVKAEDLLAKTSTGLLTKLMFRK